MTKQEIEKLFDENMEAINTMNLASGSMIKQLVMRIEKHTPNTYIRLFDAEKKGHTVSYEFLEGDKDFILEVAKHYKFKTYDESKLEVRHA
jgi:hypothetical protein